MLFFLRQVMVRIYFVNGGSEICTNSSCLFSHQSYPFILSSSALLVDMKFARAGARTRSLYVFHHLSRRTQCFFLWAGREGDFLVGIGQQLLQLDGCVSEHGGAEQGTWKTYLTPLHIEDSVAWAGG